MQTRIVVNGREYESVNAMPEDVRQAYRQALAEFADADRNGIPDVAEREVAGHVVSVRQSSLTVNGRTFDLAGEVPALVRHLCGDVMSHGAATGRGPGERDAAAPGASPHPTAVGADFAGSVPGTLLGRPRHRDPTMAAIERGSHALERFLLALLGVAAVVVFGFGVLIIATMDASARGQGGRFYVALAAVVALGALDGQAVRLAERRWGSVGLFGASGAARRFAVLTTLSLVLAAALLLGLALLLP